MEKKLVTLTMPRKRALELDLLFCICGHRVNNHFDFGTHKCAHCPCGSYREVACSGTALHTCEGEE